MKTENPWYAADGAFGNPGSLWWHFDSNDELAHWLLKAAGHVRLERVSTGTTITVVFSLDKDTAKDVLGYTPEECEWLGTEEDDDET